MNEKTNSPNLFLLGAMKSGTSSLHNWLGQHPDIFMSVVKEPGFFVEELTWNKGFDWYFQLFADAGSAKIIGESSTEYAKLPNYRNVVDKIFDFNSDAKFIFVMRDPIERTISHYWHHVRSRKKNERREILQAINEDNTLVDFSDYAAQLKPYMTRFGSDRVFTVTMEELLSDTGVWLKRIFQWLELPDDVADVIELDHKHQTPKVVTQNVGWLANMRFHPVWNSIGPFVPAVLRRIFRNLSVRATIDRTNFDKQEVIEFLQPMMKPKVEDLEALLGRNFPEWTTTLGSIAPPEIVPVGKQVL